MKTVIEMAIQAGCTANEANAWGGFLERFAKLARADEAKRADALAATIAGLRDIVTSEAESKADFIARVRELLGADPDQRVLSAVLAERQSISQVRKDMAKDDASGPVLGRTMRIIEAIEARSGK